MEQLQTQQPINNDEVQNDEVNKEWDDLPEPPTQEPEEEEQEEKAPERTLTIINCLKCGHTTKTYEDVQACEKCGYDAFAHTNEENKALMDAKKVKKVKKVQDTLHDILLKGLTKNFKDEPKLTVDKHTKVSKELVFTDILNTKYEVVEKQAQYLDEHETFSDIARRGLDPNVNNNPQVYGVGRRLEPKNVTIARMKADIDSAGAELQRRKQEYAEYISQLEQQANESNQPQPTNEPKGEPK